MPASEPLDKAAYDIVYQGQPGAFSEDAAFDFVARDARLLGLETLQEAFDIVARGEATYAVIPVENTLAGPVDETYDLLSENNLNIIDETVQTISHCLIAPPGTPIEDVHRVLSHPIALAQCEHSLRTHLRMEPVPAFDTAGAVELVIRDRVPHTGAIGSARSAEVYGGEILRENIQDHPENYTRFLLMCAPEKTCCREARGNFGKDQHLFQSAPCGPQGIGCASPLCRIWNPVDPRTFASRPRFVFRIRLLCRLHRDHGRRGRIPSLGRVEEGCPGGEGPGNLSFTRGNDQRICSKRASLMVDSRPRRRQPIRLYFHRHGRLPRRRPRTHKRRSGRFGLLDNLDELNDRSVFSRVGKMEFTRLARNTKTRSSPAHTAPASTADSAASMLQARQ